ncbi:IS110 family transposase [Streptomyces sp. NPDC004787]|uniref:IS110 family transposase n=1 Tax=Streptomyces sp. NPDC004787 TaxID=3154291 RepID=UPI0033ADCB83
MAIRLIDDIFHALDEQTVVVPGTGTLDVVILSLTARSRPSTNNAWPWKPGSANCWWPSLLSQVPTSLPGVGVRTATVLLVTADDGTSFPTAAHLASYAGLAPPPPPDSRAPRSTANTHPEGGNRQLKRAMFLCAFAAPVMFFAVLQWGRWPPGPV